MIAAIDVDWGALAEAGYVSAIAGLVIAVIAAVAVVSSLKAAQGREQAGGASAAGLYGALTIGCVVALAAIVVYGVYLLTA
jgi:hypothetical protein